MSNAAIDPKLLEILACPDDHAPVRLESDRIVCTRCGRRYPIRDGIPVMMIDEAESGDNAEPEMSKKPQ